MANSNKELKPVSFNRTNDLDNIIINYLKENNIKFGTYVKQLILNDIKANEEKNKENNVIIDAIADLKTLVSELNSTVNNCTIQSNYSEETDANNTEDIERKNIINNILNMR